MSRKRKKKSAGSVFLYGFGMSLLIICMLFLTGFASYKVSLFYFNKRGVSRGSKSSKMIQELYGAVEAEDISKNLIYSVDKQSGKITGMVLEIFNTNTGNMDYISIPIITKVTVSNELYQKLVKAGSEAPQIVKLSAMYKYFSEDTLYEFGELIMNDFLGMDISYYTVLDEADFNRMFDRIKTRVVVQTEDTAQVQKVNTWILTEELKNELKSLEKEEKAVKDYIGKFYESCTSNLSEGSKKKYAEAYLKWNVDNTYYHVLPGVKGRKSYEPLQEESRAMLERILGNSTYTEKQSLETAVTATDSKEYSIEILNASQINGLAARYKETLEGQGYTVNSVGNYTGQMQTASSILVRNEGTGADLLLYLENAQITVSESLPAGIDIQIILGTDADK